MLITFFMAFIASAASQGGSTSMPPIPTKAGPPQNAQVFVSNTTANCSGNLIDGLSIYQTDIFAEGGGCYNACVALQPNAISAQVFNVDASPNNLTTCYFWSGMNCGQPGTYGRAVSSLKGCTNISLGTDVSMQCYTGLC